MNKPFKDIPDSTLIEMCNDIYHHWINGDGVISDDLKLKIESKRFFDAGYYQSMNDMVDDVLDEATSRYSCLVKDLMIKRPYIFIDRSKH